MIHCTSRCEFSLDSSSFGDRQPLFDSLNTLLFEDHNGNKGIFISSFLWCYLQCMMLIDVVLKLTFHSTFVLIIIKTEDSSVTELFIPYKMFYLICYDTTNLLSLFETKPCNYAFYVHA